MQDFTDKPDPIQAAAPTMHNYMSNLVHEVVKLICISCLQLVSLPASIVSPAQGPPQKRQRGARNARERNDNDHNRNNTDSTPTWHSTHTMVNPAWKVPADKRPADFFHTRDETGRTNINRFPKATHHITHKAAPICTTYLSTGTCNPSCRRAHIRPSKMTRKFDDQCTAAFKTAYST